MKFQRSITQRDFVVFLPSYSTLLHMCRTSTSVSGKPSALSNQRLEQLPFSTLKFLKEYEGLLKPKSWRHVLRSAAGALLEYSLKCPAEIINNPRKFKENMGSGIRYQWCVMFNNIKFRSIGYHKTVYTQN